MSQLSLLGFKSRHLQTNMPKIFPGRNPELPFQRGPLRDIYEAINEGGEGRGEEGRKGRKGETKGGEGRPITIWHHLLKYYSSPQDTLIIKSRTD